MAEKKEKYMVELKIPAKAELLSIVRFTLATISAQLAVGSEEIEDMKIAVSEACTNAVQYAYPKKTAKENYINIKFKPQEESLEIIVQDKGCGFDVKKPPKRELHDEDIHMGLGLIFMKNLMDKVVISSVKGKGTTVKMKKLFK